MAPLCLSCGATSTPMWRSGPEGPRTLCNACGMRRSSRLVATREVCASTGAAVQRSGKRDRDLSTSSSSSPSRLSKVHGSSFAGRAAAADAATSRAGQSAEPLNVGVQKSSAVALRRGRRYFGASRGVSSPPLPQSSPTAPWVPQGTTMGCNGTGVKRGVTASFAFCRLVGGGRDLPQGTQLACSTAPEAVDGGFLFPCGPLAHESLASAAAKKGLPGLSAANKTAASHGLSWTAADAVVPFNLKKEPEPAALVKLEDLAVDNGRRRAVAYA